MKTNLPVKDGVCMAEEPAGGYTLIPPIYIGKNVQIGAAAQIGPFAVLGDGCHIGNNAKVRGSVLLDGVYIGDRAALTGALVCHGASVRRGAALFEGAAVGEGAVIGEHAAVSPHVKIWPEKQVEAGTHLPGKTCGRAARPPACSTTAACAAKRAWSSPPNSAPGWAPPSAARCGAKRWPWAAAPTKRPL